MVDKIGKSEICGACSGYVREIRRILDFVGDTSEKETSWETQAYFEG